MNRREFLGLAAIPPGQPPDRQAIGQSPGAVVANDGIRAEGIELIRDWTGTLCRSRAVNRSRVAVRLQEVVLFDVDLQVLPATTVDGEGFQMLTQTGGTRGAPGDFSQYTDAKHYRIPASEGARAYYGLLTLTPPGGDTSPFASTSCARFSGRFGARGASARAVVDTEHLSIEPGETWALEELMMAAGRDRSRLLTDLANRLVTHHPPLKFRTPPTGWCSWYCFGPSVTAQQVLDNLDPIAKSVPALRYVQIDDGYQSAMGDRLDTGAAFGGNVRTVRSEIRRRGFEPAIWVAPVVAEETSSLFQQQPDWEDAPDARSARVPGPATVTDFWAGEALTARDGTLALSMPPRSARLLEVMPRA